MSSRANSKEEKEMDIFEKLNWNLLENKIYI